ncbi:hypothetical protein AUK11_00105 [bacterium CG2_30_37_16]|nr:MAG: hypothetical protein AUK11_00105 [bacterium CG2_30_37_16]PIP30578.1 MAG: hypothetical protein COX25_04000 [bacterium (Candidatus Howlettbacteria) CG23_combo_of_CG06-09_8_20_14_all_37_9]PIX99665.1 MAG: hypothetical protein COZ22_02025 [bacterium (Candidatus Howlettbacteria) CG_4_10_14_3_um_filter_37_10]PJB06487.1 MAG: hypothetical protein CO123_02080 [bacterium (Candidatus Howlettbacteria) CG_4_9_14_3_um_filter_37_10]
MIQAVGKYIKTQPGSHHEVVIYTLHKEKIFRFWPRYDLSLAYSKFRSGDTVDSYTKVLDVMVESFRFTD